MTTMADDYWKQLFSCTIITLVISGSALNIYMLSSIIVRGHHTVTTTRIQRTNIISLASLAPGHLFLILLCAPQELASLWFKSLDQLSWSCVWSRDDVLRTIAIYSFATLCTIGLRSPAGVLVRSLLRALINNKLTDCEGVIVVQIALWTCAVTLSQVFFFAPGDAGCTHVLEWPMVAIFSDLLVVGLAVYTIYRFASDLRMICLNTSRTASEIATVDSRVSSSSSSNLSALQLELRRPEVALARTIDELRSLLWLSAVYALCWAPLMALNIIIPIAGAPNWLLAGQIARVFVYSSALVMPMMCHRIMSSGSTRSSS